jgi:RimJ/RimL family protein N-acetyltransferase
MQPSAQLFCKPQYTGEQARMLFTSSNKLDGAGISFRSLDLSTDLDIIFNWVNRAYAKRFWQLDGSKALVETTYRLILDNPATHSFIGLYNDRPVCQIDIYLLMVDELRHEVQDCRPNDCGFHLLMAPPWVSAKGLSREVLRAFLAFYFSHDRAERIFAEPDRDNVLANRLALAVGLEFLYTVRLSYKTANLYCITKEQFHEKDIIA